MAQEEGTETPLQSGPMGAAHLLLFYGSNHIVAWCHAWNHQARSLHLVRKHLSVITYGMKYLLKWIPHQVTNSKISSLSIMLCFSLPPSPFCPTEVITGKVSRRESNRIWGAKYMQIENHFICSSIGVAFKERWIPHQPELKWRPKLPTYLEGQSLTEVRFSASSRENVNGEWSKLEFFDT